MHTKSLTARYRRGGAARATPGDTNWLPGVRFVTITIFRGFFFASKYHIGWRYTELLDKNTPLTFFSHHYFNLKES